MSSPVFLETGGCEGIRSLRVRRLYDSSVSIFWRRASGSAYARERLFRILREHSDQDVVTDFDLSSIGSRHFNEDVCRIQGYF